MNEKDQAWVAAKLAMSLDVTKPLKTVVDFLTLRAHPELRRWCKKAPCRDKLRHRIHLEVVAGEKYSAEQMAKAATKVIVQHLENEQ